MPFSTPALRLSCQCPGYPLTAQPDNLSLTCYELDPDHAYADRVIGFWSAEDGGIDFYNRVALPANDTIVVGGKTYGTTVLDTGAELYTGMSQLHFVARWHATGANSALTIVNNELYQNNGVHCYWWNANNTVVFRYSTSGASFSATTGALSLNTVYGTSSFLLNTTAYMNVNGVQTASGAGPTNYIHGSNYLLIGGTDTYQGARINTLVILDSIANDVPTRQGLQDNPWQFLRCRR